MREREKKGPKLAIIELVLFCRRKSFQGVLLEEAGQIGRQCQGAGENSERNPGLGALNADYCGSEPPKKRGTLVRMKMRNYLSSLPL